MTMQFGRMALEREGFVGWRSFATLRESPCPTTGGVYVVVKEGGEPEGFAERSCGGWFKGKDPSVGVEALAANWVAEADVVYIGKADNLRRRLIQFADFGAGKPVGHWGGRLVWQMLAPDSLRVGWRETPGRVPLEVEAELIAQFRAAYGKPPFANAPHRLGR